MRALLDTSYFVAQESGRSLGELEPETETEVSVVTVAELTIGVLMATDAERATRMATLSTVESNWDPLPITVEVARAYAHLVADLRTRGRKVPELDALVAATALAAGVPVVTQDRDYDVLPGVEVIRV